MSPSSLHPSSTMGDAEPPAYNSSERIPTHRSLSSERTRQPTEHIYTLPNSKNKSWAALKVHSPARSPVYDALSAVALPTFFEGEPVTGSVEVAVEKWDHVEAIDLLMKGSITTGVSMDASFTFLDLPRVLWSKAIGEPERHNDNYVLPFSIVLPKNVAVVPKTHDTPQVFHLPPTISERHTKAGTQYELTIHIHRRGILRSDSKIGTAIGYIPSIRPDPPSRLRQRAYQSNTRLIGPEGDPEGWRPCKTTRIRGKLFNDRSIDAKFTLFLAKPLLYTRGSVIPCVMIIECDDYEVLDLLSSPNSIFVRLRRHVSYHADAVHSSTCKTSGSELKDQVQDYELAVWWVSPEQNENEKRSLSERQINGEIHLAEDLIPSSLIAHFSVSYSVVVFPFDAVAFTSADTEPLLIEPVEIGTAFATGPRPIAYAPPEYIFNPAPKREFIPPSSALL